MKSVTSVWRLVLLGLCLTHVCTARTATELSDGDVSIVSNEYESTRCVVSDWTYSACENTHQLRTRHVVHEPNGDASPCPPLEELVSCMPVHCAVSNWTPFSPCDERGYRVRTRNVIVEPAFGGMRCPWLVDRELCDTCDCHVSEWSAWRCDPATGRQSRERHVVNWPRDRGEPCPHLREEKPCTAPCVMSDWSVWDACDPVSGTRSRFRTVLSDAINGGDACPTDRVETEDCPVDCVVKYTNWSDCAPYALTQFRSGTVVVVPKNNGTACPPASVLEREERACAPTIDCVSHWSQWGKCWNGYEYRIRIVTVAPANGGKSCPPLNRRKQRRPCSYPVAVAASTTA